MELDGRTELVLAKLKHDLEKAKARGISLNDNSNNNIDGGGEGNKK